MVQEALTNVHKHARGAATEVVVRGADGDGVTVRVTNRATGRGWFTAARARVPDWSGCASGSPCPAVS